MPGFISELKRRNVIRVAGLYLVVAWLVVQVAETVLPAFAVPGWVLRGLIVLLALGFLPALIIAWAFELTPEGLRREARPDPAAPLAVRSRRIDIVIALGLAMVGALMIAERLWPRSVDRVDGVSTSPSANAHDPAPVSPAKSVAVLPFADLSPDRDHAYLADGLAEELLNALTRVQGLKVASRTTSFSFRDSGEALPEIARQMKVAHVIEGSVRRAGDRLRVTAQLIDVASDSHLWSETYDRDASDIFAIQTQIASAIARALGEKLGSADGSVAGTADTAAYNDYLQGVFFMNQRTPAALRQAIGLFEQAAAKDPKFVRAHAGLAAAWFLMPGYSNDVGRAEAHARSRDAALRAQAMDPESPEVLTVLAQILRRSGDVDWAESERMYRRAIALAPSYPTVRHWYGMMLGPAGRRDEGIAELEIAHALDPLSLPIESALAWYLSDAGRHDEAIRHSEAVLSRQPDFRNANTGAVMIYLHAGRPDDAKRALRRYLQGEGYDPQIAEHVFASLAAPHDAKLREAAIESAHRLAALETNIMTGRSLLAVLGADDVLLELLEDPDFDSVEFLATAWQFQRLRGNPRFDALLAAAGIPNREASKEKGASEKRARVN